MHKTVLDYFSCFPFLYFPLLYLITYSYSIHLSATNSDFYKTFITTSSCSNWIRKSNNYMRYLITNN